MSEKTEKKPGEMAAATAQALLSLGNAALVTAKALPSVDDAFLIRGVAHPSEEWPFGPYRVSVVAGPIDDEDDPRFEFRVTIRNVPVEVQ